MAKREEAIVKVTTETPSERRAKKRAGQPGGGDIGRSEGSLEGRVGRGEGLKQEGGGIEAKGREREKRRLRERKRVEVL
jgi:hypothetical protein